jgi:hypothetical protein
MTYEQMVSDLSRAIGLAQALANPLPETREGSTEEIAQEIVRLLEGVRTELLPTDWQALAQDILDGNREALLARLPEPHRTVLESKIEGTA